MSDVKNTLLPPIPCVVKFFPECGLTRFFSLNVGGMRNLVKRKSIICFVKYILVNVKYINVAIFVFYLIINIPSATEVLIPTVRGKVLYFENQKPFKIL